MEAPVFKIVSLVFDLIQFLFEYVVSPVFTFIYNKSLKLFRAIMGKIIVMYLNKRYKKALL